MSELVVYARPGCPFCMMLRARMRKRGLDWREVNIWEDKDAAAAVRATADGNETVPTVNVGSTWLVNPSLSELLDALTAEAPELVPPEPEGLLDKLGLRR
ncbi:MAG: glutaredoxin family protein [Sciscionella sp.]